MMPPPGDFRAGLAGAILRFCTALIVVLPACVALGAPGTSSVVTMQLVGGLVRARGLLRRAPARARLPRARRHPRRALGGPAPPQVEAAFVDKQAREIPVNASFEHVESSEYKHFPAELYGPAQRQGKALA